jgi:hypothetical protein
MTLVLGSLPGLAETVTSDFAEPSGPVSVLLLMDASGSMAESDPDGLRWEAARYFVDFLSADSVASGQSHEAGIMTFESSPTLWLEPKRVIQSEDLIKLRIQEAEKEAPSGGWTDFAHAVELAVQTIRENDRLAPGQRYAIVLFTDGLAEPGVARRNMAASQVAAHYARISEALSRLSSDLGLPVEGYVVTMGAGYGDADYWRGVLGEAAGDQRVFRVTANADYFQAFGGIGASLLGMTRCDPTVATGQIVVPNYLEGLVFTVFKPRGATLDILPAKPDGTAGAEPLKLGPVDYDSSTDTYQIVSVVKPLAGPWSFAVVGAEASDVYIWCDWIPAELVLSEPRTLMSTLRPMELRVELLYPRSLTPVSVAGDASLSLKATVSGLGGNISKVVDSQGSEASFEQTLISAPVAKGKWTVQVAPVNRATGSVVRAFTKLVFVDELPVLSAVTLQPPLLSKGATVYIRATVQGSMGLLAEPGVFYELRDAHRRLLKKDPLKLELDANGRPTGAYWELVPLPNALPSSVGDADAGSVGWFRSLLTAISPNQGQATLTVSLAGYYDVPGSTEVLRYEDTVRQSASVGLPLLWIGLALVPLLLFQFLCLWPGLAKVGEVVVTDSGGFAQVRPEVHRLNLGGGTIIKAGPQMLTRFNWGGVTMRARIRVDGDERDDLAPEDVAQGVPGAEGAYYTVENRSLTSERRAPMGLAGHVLLIPALLLSTVSVATVILPGLIGLPGLPAKVLAGLYALDLVAPLWIISAGRRRQIRER